MALDTRDKRGSALGAGMEPGTVFPNPDGSIAGADRQHTLGLYRGIILVLTTRRVSEVGTNSVQAISRTSNKAALLSRPYNQVEKL